MTVLAQLAQRRACRRERLNLRAVPSQVLANIGLKLVWKHSHNPDIRGSSTKFNLGLIDDALDTTQRGRQTRRNVFESLGYVPRRSGLHHHILICSRRRGGTCIQVCEESVSRQRSRSTSGNGGSGRGCALARGGLLERRGDQHSLRGRAL